MARRTRRRKEGRFRPFAFLAAPPRLAEVGQAAWQGLLAPPAAAYALYGRLWTRLFGLGLRRAFRPGVPTVGVGGMTSRCRGRVLLTSWLLGWAQARGISAAVAAPLGDAAPPVAPFQVMPGGDPRQSGVEAALLARYIPGGRFLVDADPARAASTAVRTFAPDMLVLLDAFTDPRVARDLDLAILDAEDLGPGWNKVLPAGTWRRDASALAKAQAFCVFAGPQGLEAAMVAAQKRLAPWGRPVFGLTFDIWRFRGPVGAVSAEVLGREPYIAVLSESDRDTLPGLFGRMLGASPRLAFFVHDRHRFTRQDFEHLRSDAARLRAANILTSPRLDLALRQGAADLPGLSVWTYDPEVVFGPSLGAEDPFLAWWEATFAAVVAARKAR